MRGTIAPLGDRTCFYPDRSERTFDTDSGVANFSAPEAVIVLRIRLEIARKKLTVLRAMDLERQSDVVDEVANGEVGLLR